MNDKLKVAEKLWEAQQRDLVRPSHKAYLVAIFKLVDGVPKFRYVDIFSSPARELTVDARNKIYFDMVETGNFSSYGEAAQKLKDLINDKTFYMHWAAKFLLPNEQNVDDPLDDILEIMKIGKTGE